MINSALYEGLDSMQATMMLTLMGISKETVKTAIPMVREQEHKALIPVPDTPLLSLFLLRMSKRTYKQTRQPHMPHEQHRVMMHSFNHLRKQVRPMVTDTAVASAPRIKQQIQESITAENIAIVRAQIDDMMTRKLKLITPQIVKGLMEEVARHTHRNSNSARARIDCVDILHETGAGVADKNFNMRKETS